MQLQSESINEIAKALSLAQSELGGTEKDGKNPHFKSAYSTLQSCLSVTREPLAKNNLSIVQQMDIVEGKQILVTTLVHASGQWFRSYAQIIIEKPTCQGMGSGISYMRRYALCAMLGLYQEDDDGNKAEKNKKKIEEISDDDYNDFIIEQKENYTEYYLQDYIDAKRTKYNLSPKQTVGQAIKDMACFHKEIKDFIEWKKRKAEKDQENAVTAAN